MTIHKDLRRVKPKVLKSLTLRQVICYGAGAAAGAALYGLAHTAVGVDAAVWLMMAAGMPFFLLGTYEDRKTGLTLEKKLALFVRARYVRPQIRTFRTKNLYIEIQNIEIQRQLNRQKEAERNEVSKRRSATVQCGRGQAVGARAGGRAKR